MMVLGMKTRVVEVPDLLRSVSALLLPLGRRVLLRVSDLLRTVSIRVDGLRYLA